jgi:lipopolysaccharide export system protein LptA
VFLNKVIILFLVFFASLVFALPEDAKQPIEIEAQSVIVDESTGFNEFSGNAEVRQGSLLLLAELIQVQTNNEEVVRMVATGSLEKPAQYTPLQH